MKLKFYPIFFFVLIGIQMTACSFTPDPSNNTGNKKTPPKPANLVLTKQLVETVPPAGVRIHFNVLTASGDSPGPLIRDDFDIINDETGGTFQSEGIGTPILGEATDISFYTVLTLDVSESIRANLLVDVVIDAALGVVNSLLNGQSGSNQRIAIYAFGRTEMSRVWVPFTGQIDLVEQGLEDLRITAKSNSFGGTNLYEAYIQSLDLVRNTNENNTTLNTRSVVLVTDGTHEAGNTIELRAQALANREAGGVEVYTVGIHGDYNPDAIRELARPLKNFFEDVDVINNTPVDCTKIEKLTLKCALETISDSVLGNSKSNYVLGVCTPVEFGTPSITIIVKKANLVGQLTIPYSIAGLNGAIGECNPGSIAKDPTVLL